jgi:hypothetical protein
MKMALACALAAFMSSAAAADESGLPHWTPGKAAIAKLDFAFRNAGLWKGSPPDAGKYNRYYAGVTIKGRRMVRAEFTVFPEAKKVDGKTEYDTNPTHVVPLDQFPMISDGGCSVVNMLYDVDADRMASIACNGVA